MSKHNWTAIPQAHKSILSGMSSVRKDKLWRYNEDGAIGLEKFGGIWPQINPNRQECEAH